MASKRRLLFCRHGESEYNLRVEERSDDVDAMELIDAALTETGKRQASTAATVLQEWLLEENPEDWLVLVSPHQRALQTCDLLLRGLQLEVQVHPLGRERLTAMDDVTAEEMNLRNRFSYDWSRVDPCRVWCYRPDRYAQLDRQQLSHAYAKDPWHEPRHVFEQRAKEWKRLLLQETRHLLVVTHFDLSNEILGYQLDNAELVETFVPQKEDHLVIRKSSIYQGEAIQIRRATDADRNWLCEFHKRQYPQYNEDFHQYVNDIIAKLDIVGRDGGWIILVAGAPCGCVFNVHVSDSVSQLRLLAVDPQLRRQGYGKELVRRSIKAAKRAGYSQITLATVKDVGPAIHIYLSFGFQLESEEETKVKWGCTDIVVQHYTKQL